MQVRRRRGDELEPRSCGGVVATSNPNPYSNAAPGKSNDGFGISELKKGEIDRGEIGGGEAGKGSDFGGDFEIKRDFLI